MAAGPRFHPEVNARISEAHELAGQRGDTHSDVAHLLIALLGSPDGSAVEEAARRGLDLSALRNQANSALPTATRTSAHAAKRRGRDEAVQVTARFMEVLNEASVHAMSSGDDEIGEIHLLNTILEASSVVEDLETSHNDRGGLHVESVSRPRTLKKLARYGRILTDEAREGRLDPVIGRESELQRLVHVLGRRRKNNPVLLGEPGVGKTAIVEGLAQAIVESHVPSSIAGRHVFALHIGSLVAGTKYRGEFETRMQEILEAIRSSDGGIILFIDEMHLIARAGGAEGAINTAGFLKPMLARGELRAIGATTIADYRNQVVGDGALERRFQPIHVAEPSPKQALEMLRGLRPMYQAHHSLTISDSALAAAVEASHLRLPHRNLPDKAIDLIDEACSRRRALEEIRLSAEGKPSTDLDHLEIIAEEVLAVLEDWLGGEEESWSHAVYGNPISGPSHG